MPRALSGTRTCTETHNHIPARKLTGLPESRAEPGRHRCAGCAYDLGYADGIKQGAWNEEQRIKELMAKVKVWAEERGQDSRTMPRSRRG